MARGWPVFPVLGKRPCTRRGFHDASVDPSQALTWWQHHPGRGVALATGTYSGLWVVDVDGDLGRASLRQLTSEFGSLPQTITARTGGGGRHFYFRMPPDQEVRSSAGRVASGIDVRGTGGYVVLPPSNHASGQKYSWEPRQGPDDLDPASAPSWLLRRVQAIPEAEVTADVRDLPAAMWTNSARYIVAAIERECLEVATASVGRRNHRLNQAAYALGRFVVRGEADARGVQRVLTHAALIAGLSLQEASRTIRSAFRARGAAT